MQRTSQTFVDEDALLEARFFTLEEDIIDPERRAARIHERHFHDAAQLVEKVKTDLSAELEARLREDTVLLDNIFETQKRLQRTVNRIFPAISIEGVGVEVAEFHFYSL